MQNGFNRMQLFLEVKKVFWVALMVTPLAATIDMLCYIYLVRRILIFILSILLSHMLISQGLMSSALMAVDWNAVKMYAYHITSFLIKEFSRSIIGKLYRRYLRLRGYGSVLRNPNVASTATEMAESPEGEIPSVDSIASGHNRIPKCCLCSKPSAQVKLPVHWPQLLLLRRCY